MDLLFNLLKSLLLWGFETTLEDLYLEIQGGGGCVWIFLFFTQQLCALKCLSSSRLSFKLMLFQEYLSSLWRLESGRTIK